MNDAANVSDSLIRSQAIARIAKLFALSPEFANLDAKFGVDLKAMPRSWLKDNAYDEIDGDIRDVADRNLQSQMARGEYEICTVRDYCDHMVRCFALRPVVVAKVLSLDKY